MTPSHWHHDWLTLEPGNVLDTLLRQTNKHVSMKTSIDHNKQAENHNLHQVLAMPDARNGSNDVNHHTSTT